MNSQQGVTFQQKFSKAKWHTPVFFEEAVRKQMPKCNYRKYTISEIINAVIKNGFILKSFDEYPAWTNENIPGEFTLVANKDFHTGEYI